MSGRALKTARSAVRVPGRNTALNTLRWLKSRWQVRIVVLGYHRISDPGQDRRGLAVSPTCFREQMEVLSRVAQVIRLQELPRFLIRNGSGKPGVVVTFDDGYSDNLRTALPVLERFAIPATFFAVSDYLGREFWWDELDRLEARGGPTPVEAELSAASDEERRRILERARACGRWRSPAPVHRALTVEELRRAANSRLIDIGAHGATHRLMPVLSIEEQRRELRQGRRVLEEIVGGPVRSFSYPHGGFSRTTKSLVSQEGYVIACCSTPDVVTARSDVLAVPRFWAREGSTDAFELFLRRWLLD